MEWNRILGVSIYSDFQMVEESHGRKVAAQSLSKCPERAREYVNILNLALIEAETYIQDKIKNDAGYVYKQCEYISSYIAKELKKSKIEVYEYLLKRATELGFDSLEQSFMALYSSSANEYYKRDLIYQKIREAESEITRKQVIADLLCRIESLGILGEIKVRLKELEATTPTALVGGYYDSGNIEELEELIKSIYDSMIDTNKMEEDLCNFIEKIKQEGFYKDLLRESIRSIYKTHKEFLRDLYREGRLDDFGIWLTGHPVNYKNPEDEVVVPFKFNP